MPTPIELWLLIESILMMIGFAAIYRWLSVLMQLMHMMDRRLDDIEREMGCIAKWRSDVLNGTGNAEPPTFFTCEMKRP